MSAHRRAKPARQVEVGAFDAGQRRCPAGRAQAGPAAALASLGLASRRDPAGQRPIAVGRHRFEWLHLDGFVQPSTGEVVWFICNAVGTDLFSAVLAAFAQAGGAGAGKLVLLVVDNAGWHVRGKLVVPDGIELAFLPPYTPELQPAEPLWPLPNEAVAQQHFATLKDLATALDERCRALAAVPEVIKARTPFGWWPGPVPTAPAPN